MWAIKRIAQGVKTYNLNLPVTRPKFRSMIHINIFIEDIKKDSKVEMGEQKCHII
jgi:hypothetical protein